MPHCLLRVTAAAVLALSLLPSAASATRRLDAHAHVNYPTAVYAYRPITYTWTVTNSWEFEGSALVLYTDINRSNVSRIRILQKAPNADCGVRREHSDYNIYCIVYRPERWKRFSMQIRVWPRRVSSVVADHYWGAAQFGGRTAGSYIDQVGDRVGRSRTTIYYR